MEPCFNYITHFFLCRVMRWRDLPHAASGILHASNSAFAVQCPCLFNQAVERKKGIPVAPAARFDDRCTELGIAQADHRQLRWGIGEFPPFLLYADDTAPSRSRLRMGFRAATVKGA